MDFYKRALELKDETVADRRYIHQNAETGLELPKTKVVKHLLVQQEKQHILVDMIFMQQCF